MLQVRVGRLRNTSYLAGQFKEGTAESKGKQRVTETPVRSLRRLHNQVQKLLARIETPDYLHSGKLKRSYLSNAETHLDNSQYFKADIAKFYPSCRRHHVYLCFKDCFGCSGDIAGILATLLTHKGHIPTGSPVSTLLSFYCHKAMFDTLAELATSNQLKMTVLQDDITFSGDDINEDFRSGVRKVIKFRGLIPKRAKQKFIHGGKSPRVTGIMVTSEGLKVPWSRHKALRDAINDFEQASTEMEMRNSYQKVMGRLSEIERVQGKIFDLKQRLKHDFRARLEFKSADLSC
ncbi:MAG: reverse transcriptase family protein [Rhodobacteraceae bacterium]|nr:reverse transcriptase family protein [Paracoccaceae bacterium]